MNKVSPDRFEPACRPPWTLTYGKEENCESWKWAEIHDADGNLVYGTPKSSNEETWIGPDDLTAIVTAVNAAAAHSNTVAREAVTLVKRFHRLHCEGEMANAGDESNADALRADASKLLAKLEQPPAPTGTKPILTKSIFKAEVLHEPDHSERMARMDFADVVAECIDGDFSGDFSLEEQIHYYDRKTADEAIEAQASDPGFFFGDDDQNEEQDHEQNKDQTGSDS